ncbi:MAG: A24 family peptidase, partial [Nocardioides sp.]
MWAVLTPLLLMLSVIDWRTRLLPTRLIIPATIAVILVGLVAALVERDLQVWIRALLGMLALRTFLWILWALRQGGMGFGDVRLGALVGFVLGWFGWAEVIIGIYAALGCFSLFVVGAAALKRDRSRLKLFTPFGPFLVAGGFVGAWFGPAIAAYLGYGSG